MQTLMMDHANILVEIRGCIDSLALNYDEKANTDDGSCQYCLAITL